MTHAKFDMWRMSRVGLGNSSEHDKAQKSYELAKSFRSEIVDAAILVELELDEVLCDYFVGHENTKRDRFKSHILSTESFGYFKKWKTIRSAIKSKSEWSELAEASNSNQLITELKNLISHRNAFAHGELVVDSMTSECSLNYFEGERKTVLVTEELMNTILDEAKAVYLWLRKLHSGYAFNSEKYAQKKLS